MHYILIFSVIFCAGPMQLQAVHRTTRGHPCVKVANKQIYCPFPGSKMANAHKAALTNSTIQVGPTMYHQSIPRELVPSTLKSSTGDVPLTQSAKAIMYYTKQDSQSGQNAFDLNDEDEHKFMHTGDPEERFIDHGEDLKRIRIGSIHSYIEENKALARRMIGEIHPDMDLLHPGSRVHYSSFHDRPDRNRTRRAIRPSPQSNRVPLCPTTVEIVTPYWASNSQQEIRAIVNTQHLQQAVQQLLCKAVQTKHCHGKCTCEQKYMWHRLLSYDPENPQCGGIKMDWFLFPSGCEAMYPA